ncbi:hypothetical protein BDN72DRAFT_831535 [Pluteus cervinus]|uniref:Uncharacterized protein n=1 Tax=Pluteus cervinus TaxID=181527 RepID=A0ACD3BCM2_9AGAR|nr:hypothetical protein BDN72DRAFT_831535 [Pluteus cervinus]
MVAHLPPAVKHLVTLRNPHTLPGPALPKLRNVFASTFREAQDKKARTGWLVLTTCALLTANRPSTIGHLYRFATEANGNSTGTTDGIAHAVNVAALMRESALKSTIFVGVPRVILSLGALHQSLGDDVRDALRRQSRRTASSENIEPIILRGRGLWDSIYAPHADKLHDKLGSYHPDFIAFIIQAYGSVLSPMPGKTKSYGDGSSIDDPDQGNLSRALGSVVGIATLRAEERVAPQLISHVFGLLKARYVENQSDEDAWLSSDEGTEWVIRTVDRIVDVVSSEAQEAQAQVKL